MTAIFSLLVRNEGVYILVDGKRGHGPMPAYEAGQLLVKLKDDFEQNAGQVMSTSRGSRI